MHSFNKLSSFISAKRKSIAVSISCPDDHEQQLVNAEEMYQSMMTRKNSERIGAEQNLHIQISR